MLDVITIILAISGLSFLLNDTGGPWDIMYTIRMKLMQNKYVGVFFYKLFDCYYCVGCWSGSLIYLLTQKNWSPILIIIWALAGGVISLMFDALLTKLSK